MQIIEDAPIEVHTYRSYADGALVVDIATQGDGVKLRVDVNEYPVFDTGTEEDYEGPVAILNAIADEVKRTNSGDLTNAEGDAKLRAFVVTILNQHPQYTNGA